MDVEKQRKKERKMVDNVDLMEEIDQKQKQKIFFLLAIVIVKIHEKAGDRY